tara:strand:+ start:1123 stop:1743 length:621 start_codon:yes stop_codon:yes gene_type:complete
MATTKSVFATLSSIAVKDKVEKKGGLDYLSWAHAWSMLKTKYPTAQRVIYEHDHTGLNYFTDGNTAYVKIGIIVNDIEHIDMLPIMDFRNKAIHIDKITSFDVIKTIQRSTAKAIAMHGLGLSLWTGEDVPTPTAAPAKEESGLIKLTKTHPNFKKVKLWIEKNPKLTFEEVMTKLSKGYTKESLNSKSISAEIDRLVSANQKNNK